MHLIVFKSNIPKYDVTLTQKAKKEKSIRLKLIKRTAQAVLFSFLLLGFP